ncbi:MAG: hypothetical protein AAFO07_19955, partial [Bacteroidota bacterium]
MNLILWSFEIVIKFRYFVGALQLLLYMTNLHVLNGDSTLDAFKKANIKGDCMLWRDLSPK